ncbi:hypothetical protein J2S08_000162 [Bacillus chungangensis]|uniref:Uncharacterized protein n=1 Tax=Bacillus chungangensis TaxID=587633 RepID=A0ABT9WM99_9BACI|nr:hypothetical protein [Bacillus chungangensis]
MQKLLPVLLIGTILYNCCVYYVFHPLFDSMWDLLPFFMFVFICTFLPIYIHGTPCILLHWITIPAFLSYGLFVEMLLFQLPILCLLLSRKLDKPRLYHYFINSIILFANSSLVADKSSMKPFISISDFPIYTFTLCDKKSRTCTCSCCSF